MVETGIDSGIMAQPRDFVSGANLSLSRDRQIKPRALARI
jgi:hypothetical protein